MPNFRIPTNGTTTSPAPNASPCNPSPGNNSPTPRTPASAHRPSPIAARTAPPSSPNIANHGCTPRRWVPHNPGNRRRGYKLPSFYSLGFFSWDDMIDEYLKAVRNNDFSELKTFYNTRLAEAWDDSNLDTLSAGAFTRYKESFGPGVPMAALVLTAAVDVQADRIEIETVAWSPYEESWSLDHTIIDGSPHESGTWKNLDDHLRRTWPHASGAQIPISLCCIDTGYATDEVYAYVRPRHRRGVRAVKGSRLPGRPIIPKRYSVIKHPGGRIHLYEIGTDTAKDNIYWRLHNTTILPVVERDIYAPFALDEPITIRPGLMHFPNSRDDEYFRQLFSERLEKTRSRAALIRRCITTRDRNEALDLRVYNLAALRILRPNWAKLAKDIAARAEKDKAARAQKAPDPVADTRQQDPQPGKPAAAERKPFIVRPARGGWMKWR
ncbi:MAG: phage terminase large subunit family protein [Desulfobacterales bacterium]|nr:phage terminase large subunit family protein [Desulfobacterales bacterium]